MADADMPEVDGRRISDLRVVDLKKELEKRNLSKSGSKKELIARLRVQLLLESARENASSQEDDDVPDLELENGAQTSVIKEYMEQRKKQMEELKKAKRRWEEEQSMSESDREPEIPPTRRTRRAVQEAYKGKTESVVDEMDTDVTPKKKAKSEDVILTEKVEDEMEIGVSPKKKGKKVEVADQKLESPEKVECVKQVKKDSRMSGEMKEDLQVSFKEKEEKSLESDQESPMKQKEYTDQNKKNATQKGELTKSKTDVQSPEKKQDGLMHGEQICSKVQPGFYENKSSKEDTRCDSSVREKDNDEQCIISDKEERTKISKINPDMDDVTDVVTSSPKEKEVITEFDKKETKADVPKNDEKLSKQRQDSDKVEENTDEESEKMEEGHGSDTEEKSVKETEVPSKDGEMGDCERKEREKRRNVEMEAMEPATKKSRRVESPSRSRSRSRSSSRSQSQSSSSSSSRSRSRSKSRSRSHSKSRSRSHSKSRSRSSSRSRSPSSDSDEERMSKVQSFNSSAGKKNLKPDDSYFTASEDTPKNEKSDNKKNGNEESMDVDGGAGDRDKESPPKEQKADIQPVQRRRRWGSTRAKTAPKKASINISTDSLKGLIPEIKPSAIKNEPVPELQSSESPESESEHEVEPEKKDLKIQRTVIQDVKHDPDVEDTRQVDVTIKEDDEEKKEEEAPKVIRHVSKQGITIGVTADEPQAARRSPSPARNPPSCIIHITNLVRPFTLGQLKELLNRYGPTKEEGFWIDKIKSHSYCTYETLEDATAARQSLHGTRWPLSNPKILSVDFAAQSELDFQKDKDHPALQTIKRQISQDVSRHREEDRGVREVRVKDRDAEREKARQEHVREWDRDKIKQRSRSRSRGRDRKSHDDRSGRRKSDEKSKDRSRSRERRRAERSKETKDKKEKKDQTEEAPAKLLDDLFCKTKATPCIYWLPLTDEQAAARSKLRKERDAERVAAREQRRKEAELAEKKREREREEVNRNRDNREWRGRDDRERIRDNRGNRIGSGRPRSRSRDRDRRGRR